MSTADNNPWNTTDDELLGGACAPPTAVPLESTPGPQPVESTDTLASEWDAPEEPSSPAPHHLLSITQVTPQAEPKASKPVPTPSPQAAPVLQEVTPRKSESQPNPRKSTPEALASVGMPMKSKMAVGACALVVVCALGASLAVLFASPASNAPVAVPTVQAPAAPAPTPELEPDVVAPSAPEAPAPAMDAPALTLEAPMPAMEAPPLVAPTPAPDVPANPTPQAAPPVVQSKPALPPELVVPTPPSAQDQVAQLPPPPPGAAQTAGQTKKVAPTTAPRAVAKHRAAKPDPVNESPDGWDVAQRQMEEYLRQQQSR